MSVASISRIMLPATQKWFAGTWHLWDVKRHFFCAEKTSQIHEGPHITGLKIFAANILVSGATEY